MRFHGEAEFRRDRRGPLRQGLVARVAVEGVVDLTAGEDAAVVGEELARRQILRVE